MYKVGECFLFSDSADLSIYCVSYFDVEALDWKIVLDVVGASLSLFEEPDDGGVDIIFIEIESL